MGRIRKKPSVVPSTTSSQADVHNNSRTSPSTDSGISSGVSLSPDLGNTSAWERQARRNFIDRLEEKGRSLQEAGKLQEAIDIYRKLIEEVPDYKPAYLEMVGCYRDLNRLEDAFAAIQKGVSFLREGETGEAAETLWHQYVELSRRLSNNLEEIHALKALVVFKEKEGATGSDEEYLNILRDLERLLEVENDGSLLFYQKRLLAAEEAADASASVILSLHIKIAGNLIESGKTDDMIDNLHLALNGILSNNDHLGVPLDIVIRGITLLGERIVGRAMEIRAEKDLSYKELDVSSQMQGLKEILAYSRKFDLIKIGRTDKRIIICDFLKNNSSFAAVICIAVMRCGEDFAMIEEVMRNITKNDDGGKYANILLKLVKTLLENDHPERARILLEIYQSKFAEFDSEPSHMLMGDIFQNLDKIPEAQEAYRKVLAIRPSNRTAKHRLNRLTFEFPNKCVTVGDKARARNLNYQVDLTSRYKYAMEAFDEFGKVNWEDIIQIVHDLLSSTFDKFSVHIDPATYLWDLKTPFTVERGLKSYTLPSPVISSGKITTDELFDMVTHAINAAYGLGRLDEAVNIAFLAIRHKEFFDCPEKLDRLKTAICVVSYYIHYTDPCGKLVDTHRFALEYLRGELNRHSPETLHTFGIPKYNLYHLLICEEAKEDSKAVSNRCVKWATHLTKKKGFSLEIAMIMANDAMRKGSLEKSYKLHMKIVEHLGEPYVSWQIWLNLAILSVDMALRYDCPTQRRGAIYSRGMLFMEKYAQLRGDCPEVWFNKARAAQQFGDVGSAVRFYQNCLDLCRGVVLESRNYERDRLIMELSFQAAFNLRVIFANQQQVLLTRTVDQSFLNWKQVKAVYG